MDLPGLGPTGLSCLEEAGKEPGAQGEVCGQGSTFSPASWSPPAFGAGLYGYADGRRNGNRRKKA